MLVVVAWESSYLQLSQLSLDVESLVKSKYINFFLTFFLHCSRTIKYYYHIYLYLYLSTVLYFVHKTLVLGIIDVNGIHYPTIVMGIYVIVTHVILFLGKLNKHMLAFNYLVVISFFLLFSWIYRYNAREKRGVIKNETKQSGKSFSN